MPSWVLCTSSSNVMAWGKQHRDKSAVLWRTGTLYLIKAASGNPKPQAAATGQSYGNDPCSGR